MPTTKFLQPNSARLQKRCGTRVPSGSSSASTFNTSNFTSAGSQGENTNQFVTRIDQNISGKTRIFGRFAYNGMLNLPTNPFGTGLCQDRCAEDYHTKALAIDINHVFSPNCRRLEYFRKPFRLPPFANPRGLRSYCTGMALEL